VLGGCGSATLSKQEGSALYASSCGPSLGVVVSARCFAQSAESKYFLSPPMRFSMMLFFDGSVPYFLIS
jgi:hypothetical protein